MMLEGLCSSCFAAIDTYPCPVCGYDPEKRTEDSDALPIGTVLREKYQIGRVVTAGAGAISYLGMDVSDRTPLMIREYFPVSMAGRDADGVTVLQLPSAKQAFLAGVGSFLREARTLRTLKSIPCLHVSTADFLENRTVYTVYPLPVGKTLTALVKQGTPLSYEEAYRLFLPVLQAIQACHTRELLHLAIRPDNLVYTEDGILKLIGFSGAEYAVSQAPEKDMASPYTPPEFQNEPGRVGPWTDVYGAAASFYFALTGLVPGPTPLSLCDCAVRLPLTASDLIQHILTERSPENRMTSMSTMLDAMNEAGATTPEPEEKLLVWEAAFPAPHAAPSTETSAAPDVGNETDAPTEVPQAPPTQEEPPTFAENRTDPVTCQRRKRKRRASFFWITLLCLFAAAAAVGLTFFLPRPQETGTNEIQNETVEVAHRWLGIQLEVPSEYSLVETDEMLCLSSDAGVTLRFTFSVFCGTALYEPEDAYEELSAFLEGYGEQNGLSDLQWEDPEWVMLPVDEALRLTGKCRKAEESADFVLYAIKAKNDAGCLLVSIVRQDGEDALLEQAEAIVRTLTLTGKTGSSIQVAENEKLGIRYMYDAALLKGASETEHEEVRLYLRTAPSQSICICLPQPKGQTSAEEYCKEQLAGVRKSLGNRLKLEEKRTVDGKLGSWNGAEYRYDVYDDSYSVREEMYVDRNGRLLNLYFYAGNDTADAMRQAAELIMQSAEQLP